MILLSLALTASLKSLPADLNWRELGPSPISGGFSGRVAAIGCSATDANKYYVGGADGGVWKTTNGGTTWINLTDEQPTSSVGAIAVDPTNDNVVYVGTGEANYANHSRYGLGLLKTTDGGSSWSLLAQSTFAGRTFSKIVIDPTNTQVLFASIAAAGGFPEKAAAKGHPSKDGPLGVFKSTDGGVTWTQLLNGIPNQAGTDISLCSSNPSIVYAAIGRPFGSTQNGVYRSTDSGANWSKLGGGLPTGNVGRVAVAVSPDDSNRVYALYVNPCDSAGNNGTTLNGYKSTDGGATWTTAPVGSFQATYGWYLCAVGVQPGSPSTAVYAGYDLLRTTTGGASFSTITTQHVDNHAIAWDASGRLLCGCDGGLFRSANNGSSWINLNTGLGITQFYAAISLSPANTDLVLGGLQDNGTVQRNGNTSTWGNYIGGDGGYTAIDQLQPSHEFAQYQGAGDIYRSTNTGGSWSPVGTGISGADRAAFFTPVEIDPTNSNRVLLGTQRVYRSTNGGTSWAAISGDVTNGAGAIRAMSISASNPNTVWLATTDGNVSRSTDGGATFTKMLTGVPGWPRVTREVTVDPISDQTVYLAVSNFGIDQVRRTINGGSTWQTLDGDLPDVPVNVVVPDHRYPKVILYAGTDDGLYATMDEGSHWARFGRGLPHCPVIDIKIDVPHNRMVVGTQGRGAWQITLPQLIGPGIKK